MKTICLLITIVVFTAFGTVDGKILDYSNNTIRYSIYYPDHDRDPFTSESVVTVHVKFYITWEYRNGTIEENRYQTSIEVYTNYNQEFRFDVPANTLQMKKATINLSVSGHSIDVYIVNFKIEGF